MLGDLRKNKLIIVGKETERKERVERNGVCERRKGRTIKVYKYKKKPLTARYHLCIMRNVLLETNRIFAEICINMCYVLSFL